MPQRPVVRVRWCYPACRQRNISGHRDLAATWIVVILEPLTDRGS
jgi:hypothetical protein